MAYIPTPEEAEEIERQWVKLWMKKRIETREARLAAAEKKPAQEKQRIERKARANAMSAEEMQRYEDLLAVRYSTYRPPATKTDTSVWAETICKEEERDAARRALEDERTAQQAHVRARRMEGITTRSRSNSIWLGKI